MKVFVAISVVVVAFSAIVLAQDPATPSAEDSVAKTLGTAKQAFQSKVEEARRKLLPAFDVELKRINERKLPAEQQIQLIEQCQEARKAFEQDESALPSIPGMKAAVTEYRTAVLTARKKCEAAFDAAAAAYLAKKPSDLDAAKAVIAEKRSFFKGLPASDKPSVGSPFNLIPHLMPESDSLKGKWTVGKDGVSSTDGRLRLPYTPGEEYDFHVEFTRSEGDGDVVQMLSQGEHRFAWVMGFKGNSGFGFSRIGGKNADSNVSWVKKAPALDNGKRYDCVVQVRKRCVKALLNGKEIASYETDFADMSEQPYWATNAPLALGCNTATTFHVIEVTPITGAGTLSVDNDEGKGTKITVKAAGPPQSAGRFEPGTYTVVATGRWSTDGKTFVSADGVPARKYDNGSCLMQLVAIVDGKLVPIGAKGVIKVEEATEIKFTASDANRGDNSGELSVVIQRQD